ncbi:3-hydroxyacyl-CoA dehydrogenase NAD-binding domain-containing protein [Thiohalobacter thiocyanaticus]|uniref:enoyl-CoA hydratase n=1 Tax=Thiohalobacter thiocyanaticus TaxID=585455 RepID=A0A426QFQ2_9GAMM|nr:3-hydroxyacyl-CoA dehydrogenase NAD-binding domain-containing protein [Thiohalobacter thiocyanaticus]RRQ20573.1 crotonase [Thiohalobacter thiocyanaticus]
MSWRDWNLETDAAGIAWLTLDRADAGTNVLTEQVLDEFDQALDRLEQSPPAGLVIRSAKPNGFIAGADVRAFTQLESRDQALELIRRGQAACDRLETLPCPTLALIHGFCLGGGLELALACRYRIAVDQPNTRLGLPEVRLGIHPGFGGSVRSIAAIGAPAALDLMLTGRSVSARQARRLGLVQHAVPERHAGTAARTVLQEGRTLPRLAWWKRVANHKLMRPLLAAVMRRKVAAKARPEHYPAPYALLDLWVKHGDDRRAMFAAEAESVADLIRGETAQNLVRVFFLQERLKGLAKGNKPEPTHVHVIGAGVMGGDIAAWCALQGWRVTLQDQSPERIAPAVGRAGSLFRRRLKTDREVTAALDRLIPDHRGQHVGHADVVIEAIFEDREAKQQLYQAIEPRLRPDALLATNTSSIPLEELATALSRPERLVGLHFFNPVARMQLVEVVRGGQTAPEVFERALAFTRGIDRLPLPVASKPGFLVNRILMPYLLEAVELVEEGVPPARIDAAALEFGMPMGPITLADTVGLDICLHVARILGEAFGLAVPVRLEQLVADGHLGRKSGRGFYRYHKGKPIRTRVTASTVPQDIEARLIMRLLNEAAACLREGVVEDSDLLDAGMIFGTGFAPFRGGPMHYAGDRGVEDILIQLHDLEARHGERFAPDPWWEQRHETD